MKINLYCIPYAGGSALVYNQWKKYLPPNIQLRPIELAGRGTRIKESLPEDLAEIIEDIYVKIRSMNGSEPFALFGHSMGSLIVYELAKKFELLSNGPLHLFFSSRNPPSKPTDRKIYDLPDKEFINEILKFGGMSHEVLTNEELLNVFLPILRQDIKINDTYIFNDVNKQLKTTATVFFGRDDVVTLEDACNWKSCFMQKVEIYEFEGGHFYIREKMRDLLDIMTGILLKKLSEVPV